MNSNLIFLFVTDESLTIDSNAVTFFPSSVQKSKSLVQRGGYPPPSSYSFEISHSVLQISQTHSQANPNFPSLSLLRSEFPCFPSHFSIFTL